MTDAETLQWADATDQADLVSRGDATPLELVDAAIERIEKLNDSLNAVIWTDFEAARTSAANHDRSGPFAGVPFLLKDIGATQAGLPYWLGNQALKKQNNQSVGDTELGSRFRAAGLITLGKTNLPELGSCPTTQPLSCGPTNNPWDLSRSPAGSSGGSAAAVAAGMVPMAHANDGGGSTRLPAAWCGLVGLKTTRGRVPNRWNISRLVSELVVSRSVRDTAALLDAVEGATDGDLFSVDRPNQAYTASRLLPPPPLRVAVLTDGGTHQVDPECVLAVEDTATMLESMGHHVEVVDSEALLGGDSSVNGRLWMGGIARRVQMLSDYAGRELTEDEVEPYNWTAAMRGASVSAAQLMAAEEQQQAWSVLFIEWMSNFDILLTPTSACPPMETDSLWPPDDKPWKVASSYARIGLFTLPFNVTGQPAISLPLHETPSGLPVGVQLVAGMGREDVLLQLATQLEEAMPWAQRRPVNS